MRSKFAIAGHPLHPMLVALPIGHFAWALVCDISCRGADKNAMWYDIPFWTGMAAIVTVPRAALPGCDDCFTLALRGDASRIADAHMAMNLTVVAICFVAILLMREDGARTGGRLTAVVVLLLPGWLGSELVFRHQLAVVSDDAELERSEAVRHHGSHDLPRRH